MHLFSQYSYFFCRRTLFRILTLCLGAMILAFGMFNIHNRTHITEGGILGLTLFIQHWTGITPGVSGIVLDSLCYLMGFKLLGKSFLVFAACSSVFFSMWYNLFSLFGYMLPDLSNQPLLAALAGGIFVGVGVGLIVRAGGASGGDDALALIIHKKTPLKLAQAYFITDFIVLMLSLSYIPLHKIACSLLTVTLSSFLIGKIHGLSFPKKKSQDNQSQT